MARKKYIRRRIVKQATFGEEMPQSFLEDFMALLAADEKRYKYVRFGITTDLRHEYDKRKQKDDICWSSMKVYYQTANPELPERFQRENRDNEHYINNNTSFFPESLYEERPTFYFYTMVGRRRKSMKRRKIRFIDLFAGIGGIRLGLEQAAEKLGYQTECVFTSEIKKHAIEILKQNHPKDKITGDITKVVAEDIPDFDILCGGFPCQAFSAAGNRDGFADTRGTLFFDVERIIKAKKPLGFILENVEGLAHHDGGNTLEVILSNLNAAEYRTSYRVLNSADFGVAQDRKRIYFVGIRKDISEKCVNIENFLSEHITLEKVLESGKPTSMSPFVQKLLSLYSVEELAGKAIKDKRGGSSNIHSWDLELKGHISKEQKKLLNQLMTERRKKKWASIIGIKWMDGMPLTTEQISEFYPAENLQEMLDDLTSKGYLRLEHPKEQKSESHIAPNGKTVTTTRRVYATNKPKGYNIVAGKLSYEVGKILSPQEIAPTLVATDMQHLYVVDNGGLRTLTLREGLRLFGYPESYKFNINENDGFDLLGNTVVVPVIKAVATRLLESI